MYRKPLQQELKKLFFYFVIITDLNVSTLNESLHISQIQLLYKNATMQHMQSVPFHNAFETLHGV